ncbi:hypothetical protein SESBI_44975 [Sesbania bispinosa]|nr:hypothetical protein SESBI_44975 [Sesbania bispinosa]
MELDEELGGEVISRVENRVERGRERVREVGTKEGISCRRQRWNLFVPLPLAFTVLNEIENEMLPYDWNELWVETIFLEFPSHLPAVEYRSDSHSALIAAWPGAGVHCLFCNSVM